MKFEFYLFYVESLEVDFVNWDITQLKKCLQKCKE